MCVTINVVLVRVRRIDCGVTSYYKGSEIRDTCFSRFSSCVINLSRNKNICCGLKKVVAKSFSGSTFEQESLALMLGFFAQIRWQVVDCFIQFVVYSMRMRNPVVYRTAKKVVFCWLLEFYRCTELNLNTWLKWHHFARSQLWLPHTSRVFVVELQILLSGSNRVKICRDISLPHTSRFFVATNRV